MNQTGMDGEAAFLRALFQVALAAVDPRVVVPPALPEKPAGRCVVVGAGKAAAVMAQAVELAWPDVALSGVVVVPYGHAVPAGRIAVLEAAHPVPDAASEAAARRILAAVAGLAPHDLVLALMSGGGSAVMALPAPGLSLGDKQAVTRALLRSGATIAEINAVRRRYSAIKGGRLGAAASPARLVTLAISDVPGDDPAVIGSGPTVPDENGVDTADVLRRYGVAMPERARPLPPGRGFTAEFRLIATPAMALAAAARAAVRAGVQPLVLGDALEGEARELGRVLAGMALSCRRHGMPAAAPCVLLSGGEATVTLTGNAGRGGRNTEFLLALMCALRGESEICALACDTDGIDGSGDAAGAFVTPAMWAQAASARVNPVTALAAHESYRMFETLESLIVTGPTLTNVNDFRAIMVGGLPH